MKRIALALALAVCGGVAFAQSTPVGLWKTFDDDGKAEKSLVRVTEVGGRLQGRIEKIFDPARQDAKCDKCEGERKDKPILGMVIFSGAQPDAEEKDVWFGPEIVKPDEGKVYKKVRLQLTDGGKKLKVRGYLGFFFATREWIRVEQ